MTRIDLHLHTTASDGSCSPAEAVHIAREAQLAAIAVTDHDTVSGYAEAARAGAELGVEVIAGIEISTRFEGDVHILGYCFHPESEALRAVLDWIVQDRDARNRRIVALMAADGLPITYEDMQRRYGQVVGRPHFADFLVRQGLAESVQDAFDRYVERGRKYYMPRTFLSIERSIEVIAQAGGVPVLAHPFQYKLDDGALRRLIEHCMDCGLRGMECRYSGYSQAQTAYLLSLAEEYGLQPTGGSDFHGIAKPHLRRGSGTGDLAVPYEYLLGLRELVGK